MDGWLRWLASSVYWSVLVVSRQHEMTVCMLLMLHVGFLCKTGSYFYSFTPVSRSCQAGKVFRCFLRYVTEILWTLLSAWSQSVSLIRLVSAQSLPLSQRATCFCRSQIKSVWVWDSACQKRPPAPLHHHNLLLPPSEWCHCGSCVGTMVETGTRYREARASRDPSGLQGEDFWSSQV